MHALRHFALPSLTAEEADAVLRVLGELEEAIWAAHDHGLTEIAIREAHSLQHEHDEAGLIDSDDDPNDDLPW